MGKIKQYLVPYNLFVEYTYTAGRHKNGQNRKCNFLSIISSLDLLPTDFSCFQLDHLIRTGIRRRRGRKKKKGKRRRAPYMNNE
jgi:hypothetical protein